MAEQFGEYELERLIATGGMAEIYLARQAGFGGLVRSLVVKRMLPQLAVRPDFVRMFLDEARLAANLNHPNIVQVFNLGEVNKSYYIAMELVDGPHLGTLFAHSLRQRRPLSIELCAWIIARAADGLHYAHERADATTGEPLHLVHRDISPQNILISRVGEVKVTDFGVAKASTQQTKTRTGVIKGKVAYMSPEQCLGEQVDRRTDVFALGIVLYELLTRRRLFRDKSDLLIMQKITSEDVPPPSSANKELSPDLDEICKRALSRDLAGRYSSAAELSEALDGWLAARRVGDVRERLQHWFERHGASLTVGAGTEFPGSGEAVGVAAGEATTATPALDPNVAIGTDLQTMRPADQRPVAKVAPESDLEDEVTARSPRVSSDEGLDTIAMPVSGLDLGSLVTEKRPAASRRAESSGLAEKTPRRRALMIGVPAGLVIAAVAGLLVFGGRAPPDSRAANPMSTAGTSTARLIIDSFPSGVQILLDDERVVGKTPLTIEHAAGAVKLQAQFPDQPAVSELLEVAAGKEYSVKLVAQVPLVVRSTPAKAKVRLDGELLGETPLEKPAILAPGKPVKVRVELAGWSTFEAEVSPTEGEPLVVQAALERPRAELRPMERKTTYGLLNMRSTPWVNVTVQGTGLKLGATILAQAKVPAGRQVFVLSNPEEGISDTITLNVPEEKAISVTLEWEKRGEQWKLKNKTVK